MHTSSELKEYCSLLRFKFFQFNFCITKFEYHRIWRVRVSFSYRHRFNRIFSINISAFCSSLLPDTWTFPVAYVIINIVQAIQKSTVHSASDPWLWQLSVYVNGAEWNHWVTERSAIYNIKNITPRHRDTNDWSFIPDSGIQRGY